MVPIGYRKCGITPLGLTGSLNRAIIPCLDTDDFILEQQTAQKLLIKTFLVHEVALKLNDPKMLKFLARMELILYEIANAEEEQLAETLSSVRFIIDEARLLTEVRELKELIESRGTPASLPG